jgi:hypothetical protein
MNIRKPYTISESEKNRIRGLHSNFKNIINEQYSDEELNELKLAGEGDCCGGGLHCAHGCCDCECCEYDQKPDFMTIPPNGGSDERIDREVEMGETALPTGWTMKTPEELQEEAGMDDIYEIWSGQEDSDSLRESMRDTGTSGEMVYELPRRFGKKRLTESQLISMINTIIK